MKLMSTVNKISAWVLAVCFLLYVVSGFDIQIRIFSPRLSTLFHLKYLFILAQTSFTIHTSYAIYGIMKRRKFWNVWGKIVLGAYIALNLALFGLYAATRF